MDIASPIRFLGAFILDLIEYFGSLAILVKDTAVAVFRGKWRWGVFLEQMMEIGVRSQPVIIITGGFTGAVLTAQALYQFTAVKMETAAGALTTVGMLRELGPTITGLMLAGRIGSAMAAEIGTMKVTEQVDALRSMNIHPIDYLVIPRLSGMIFSVPILAVEAVFCGILASWMVAVPVFGVGEGYFFKQIATYVDLTDFAITMIKSAVFGIIIVLISCHQGLTTSNGAVGVGQATTRAMVFSSLGILMANFLLTLILNVIFPAGFNK